MAIKITKKIKGYSVLKPEDKAKEAAPVAVPVAAPVAEVVPVSNIIQMHEKLERPEALVGATYKIKSPLVEHAMYVTINDIVLNQGTEHELRRPFEVFINSKNMDHFQWVVAITRIMSAVFRKGGMMGGGPGMAGAEDMMAKRMEMMEKRMDMMQMMMQGRMGMPEGVPAKPAN